MGIDGDLSAGDRGDMLGGTLAILQLPVARLPSIAPPQITISASYPGAPAEAMDAVGKLAGKLPSVLGGMIAATLPGIFYVPLFFVRVSKFAGRSRSMERSVAESALSPIRSGPIGAEAQYR